MQTNGAPTPARELIVPAPLVKGPPAPPVPWWNGAWVIPSATGVGIAGIIAAVLVLRSLRRRRLPAHERGYRTLAKRLRLTGREQALVRELCTRVEAPVTDRAGALTARREPERGAPPRRGVSIEDVVEFISKSNSGSPKRAGKPELRAIAPAPPPPPRPPAPTLADVKPASLLLSERAFLSAANRWLREPGRREPDRQRLLAVQTKVFASSR